MTTVLAPETAEAEMKFASAYHGPAVDTGRMDAKQFAPALFALANLVERAAEVVFEQPDALTLQVNANFRRGSFEFELIAKAVVTAVGVQILTSPLSLADLDLLLRRIGLIPGDDWSLLTYLKRFGNRPVAEAQPTGDRNVSIRIEGDNNHITISRDVYRLVLDPQARAQLEEVAAPVSSAGITKFVSGRELNDVVEITKDDVPRLSAPGEVRNELSDSSAQTAVEIISPSFRDGNKWRLAQGGEPFWATIEDPTFRERIESGERFGKGDYLIVQMRTRTAATGVGLEVERVVEQVVDLRHRSRPQQSLFDAPDGE